MSPGGGDGIVTIVESSLIHRLTGHVVNGAQQIVEHVELMTAQIVEVATLASHIRLHAPTHTGSRQISL